MARRPQFPIYLPSKGRWRQHITMSALDEMGLPYQVVVEEQEADAYRTVLGPSKVLILDPAYKAAYDTCDPHGLTKSTGSGPARNFIWDHAQAAGHPWHWIMDDNITSFLHRTPRGRVNAVDGTMFRLMEDFTLRYTNVAMAGPNYHMFMPETNRNVKPFTLNTRVYSTILIRNDLPFRWRARYNEDTDLSLRVMKAGWCTILFNAFLQLKIATQVVPGGNTDELYQDGTAAKSAMLQRLHPDVTRVVTKWNRTHHHVDYRKFEKLRLIRRPDLPAATGKRDHVRLVELDEGVSGRKTPEYWAAKLQAKDGP